MSLTAFFLAAGLLAFTPGPGIACVVARTVAGGRAEGLASCAGTALGGVLHVIATALGLSLLVAQSALAFGIVKFVGAGYLIFLGVRLLMSHGPSVAVRSVPARGARRAFLEGVAVEAMNIKTAMFFLAFLPPFVSPSEPVMPQLVLLGCICVVLNTLADVLAVCAAARLLASDAARAARTRLLGRISGVTMIGLGASLALARRHS